MVQHKQGEFGGRPMGQYRAEPAREGVETMHPAPRKGDEDIVRSAHINENADADRNDRQVNVIWSAGFVDGEGCIYISSDVRRSGSRMYGVRLVVTQKYRGPLDVLSSLYGGKVYERHLKSGAHWFQWLVMDNVALRCLREIRPYLKLKAEQADIAIRFQSEFMFRRGRTPLTKIELEQREDARLRLKAMHS